MVMTATSEPPSCKDDDSNVMLLPPKPNNGALLKKPSAGDSGTEVRRVETKNAKLIRISCAGELFITTEHSLSNYPYTLLGNPNKRSKYYNEEEDAFYFDRNQEIFSSILYFYQSPGTFRAPEYFDPVVVEEELSFFEIDLPKMISEYDEAEKSKAEPVNLTGLQIVHKTITDPGFNKVSFGWAAIDMACIFITITMMVVESAERYKDYFVDPFETPLKRGIYSFDVFVNTFFTIDLLVRFWTWPNRRQFFKNILNIMDILAVMPFYIELIVLSSTTGAAPTQFMALKVCRIVRVVRVLKIVRHSKQLTEVIEVVASAKQEFVMLIGIVSLVVLLVGTVMYFIETLSDSEKGFDSILHGCWWGIVTITTVGYGDLSPGSGLGKLFGSLIVLFGIVVLAFPMTIIISKFQDAFTMKKLKANKEMTMKLRKIAELSVCGVTGRSSTVSKNGNLPQLHEERRNLDHQLI